MDKQELPINNPAERLYVILTKAAESSLESSIEDVLCTSMNLEPNDENFIKGFSQLIGLLEIIEEQVRHFSGRKKTAYLASIHAIRKELFHSIKLYYLNNSNQNQYLWRNVSPLNDSNWPILQSFNSCVDDFEQSGISNDSLIQLIDDIDTWLLEIKKSEFDGSIKEFLISTFMEIKHLLEKYYYYGSHRIESEILAAITKITLYSKNLTAENKSIFDKSSEKLLKMLDLFIKPLSAYFLGEKLFSEAIHPMITEVIDKAQHLIPPGS